MSQPDLTTTTTSQLDTSLAEAPSAWRVALILLVRDISWDRQVRDASVETAVTERLEPHPSIG